MNFDTENNDGKPTRLKRASLFGEEDLFGTRTSDSKDYSYLLGEDRVSDEVQPGLDEAAQLAALGLRNDASVRDHRELPTGFYAGLSATSDDRRSAPYQTTWLSIKNELIPALEEALAVVQSEMARRDRAILGLGLFLHIQYEAQKVPVSEYKTSVYAALKTALSAQLSAYQAKLTEGTSFIAADLHAKETDELLARVIVLAHSWSRSSCSGNGLITAAEYPTAIGLFTALLRSSHLGTSCQNVLAIVAEKLNLGQAGSDRLMAIVEAAQRHVDSQAQLAAHTKKATTLSRPVESAGACASGTKPGVPAKPAPRDVSPYFHLAVSHH